MFLTSIIVEGLLFVNDILVHIFVVINVEKICAKSLTRLVDRCYIFLADMSIWLDLVRRELRKRAKRFSN